MSNLARCDAAINSSGFLGEGVGVSVGMVAGVGVGAPVHIQDSILGCTFEDCVGSNVVEVVGEVVDASADAVLNRRVTCNVFSLFVTLIGMAQTVNRAQ
jgi:hypothetical protein